jgi:hypothetical protein
LGAIRDWIDDENTPKWMFCLLDVAGSGKSTVTKSMAEEWKWQRRLVARYFFSRDTAETMSTRFFCLTVANAFANVDHGFKKHMNEFKTRPDWELLTFEEQFEGLVAGPLRATNRRAILTIDALDECENEYRSRTLLLDTLRKNQPSTPLLRIFTTGRPERDIKDWVNESDVGYVTFMQLEGDNRDIEVYIKSRLPLNIQDRLYPVIRDADGLFIWARIACDLILQTDNVEGLLKALGQEVSLDHLYKTALEQSKPKDTASQHARIMVLQMILASQTPLSIAELEELSPIRGVVEQVVSRLSSLLLYENHQKPIRLLHATLREFLTAQSKAGGYFVQIELGHYRLAAGCIRILSRQLRQPLLNLRQLDAISARKVIRF